MNSEFIIQNEERTIEYNDFNFSRMRGSLLNIIQTNEHPKHIKFRRFYTQIQSA